MDVKQINMKAKQRNIKAQYRYDLPQSYLSSSANIHEISLRNMEKSVTPLQKKPMAFHNCSYNTLYFHSPIKSTSTKVIFFEVERRSKMTLFDMMTPPRSAAQLNPLWCARVRVMGRPRTG